MSLNSCRQRCGVVAACFPAAGASRRDAVVFTHYADLCVLEAAFEIWAYRCDEYYELVFVGRFHAYARACSYFNRAQV